MARDKNIVRSVSCTTRKPRKGEKNGKDYFFINLGKFKAMVSRGEFLEWARVHRNLYGTPRGWVEGQLKKGKDVLLVIDVQGGRSIKRQFPSSHLIFLKPPSFRVLKERLLRRHSDNPGAIRVRLKDARKEMKEGRHYDHQVINGVLSKAVQQVQTLIRQARRKKQPSS